MYNFRAIQNYGEHYSRTGEFETYAFFRALSDFFGIFMLSLLIGALMGCFTALISFLNPKHITKCHVLNNRFILCFHIFDLFC